jgi:hypothetical protein
MEALAVAFDEGLDHGAVLILGKIASEESGIQNS